MQNNVTNQDHYMNNDTQDALDAQLVAYAQRARPGRYRKLERLSFTAAAGGLAFAGGDAMGAIVHNTTSITLSVPLGTSATFFIDLDATATQNVTGNSSFSGQDWAVFMSSGLWAGAVGSQPVVGATGSNAALKLAPNALVGPTLASGTFLPRPRLYSNFGTASGPFLNGTTGYIGLRFQGDTGTVGLQYAWLKLRFDVESSPDVFKMTILEWAYDTSGAPIRVGDTGASNSVDSPATPLLSLLGLGAMGLTTYRRRREQGLKRLAAMEGATAI